MGLPGHRRTSSHKRRRAAHFALKKLVLSACVKCQQPIQPHHACRNCGFYKGREVVSTGKKTERLLKKAKSAAPAAKDDHDHEGHDHAADEKKTKKAKKTSPKS